MNRRKLLVLALAVCLTAILAIGGTLAYFTDQDSAINTFTMGEGVSIDLFEHDDDGKEVDARTYGGVLPGVTYAKDPTVRNDGATDAWIRVNVTLTNYDIFRAAAALHGVTDLSVIFGGHDEGKWTRASITEDAAADSISYSYYYNAAIAPEELTAPLFTDVTIPESFTGGDLEGLTSFEIRVTADAIQREPFTNAAEAFQAFDAAH